MGILRRGLSTGVWLALVVMVMECEAYGQRTTSTSASTSAGTAASTQFVPVPFMMPMGQSSPFGGGSGGGDGSTNVFNNPAASPMLYGSMFPMSQNQAGWMMLANQAQMTGIGSGRLSGVRPGAGASGRGQAAGAMMSAPARRSSGGPGGLAAHYFNRTTPMASRTPQGYYNRRPSQFPDRSH